MAVLMQMLMALRTRMTIAQMNLVPLKTMDAHGQTVMVTGFSTRMTIVPMFLEQQQMQAAQSIQLKVLMNCPLSLDQIHLRLTLLLKSNSPKHSALLKRIARQKL